MRRSDKRTPLQISIQRLTNLIGMPDRDLCEIDHKTAAVPPPRPWCEFPDYCEEREQWVSCWGRAMWRTVVGGYGSRDGCDGHVARAVRARLWLQRRRLELDEKAGKQ